MSPCNIIFIWAFNRLSRLRNPISISYSTFRNTRLKVEGRQADDQIIPETKNTQVELVC